MKYDKKFVLIVMTCVLSIVGPALDANAAGTSTTNSGDWSLGVNWTQGEPTVAEFVQIDSVGVVVTQTGEICSQLNIGRFGTGELTVISGDVTSAGTMLLGHVTTGDLIIQGGLVDITTNATLGFQTGANGTLTLSGGTILIGATLVIGNPSSAAIGEVIIDGGGGTITVGSSALIGFSQAAGGSGTLTVRPTANGAAGLSTLTITTSLNLGADSLLRFDPQYTVQVGDSWTILSAGGGINGAFAAINVIPEGVEISTVAARGGTPIITVTVTVAPAAAAMPVAQVWGLALTALLIAFAGGFMLWRRRHHSA